MSNTSSAEALNAFISNLRDYVDAGASLVHIRTGEIDRTVTAVLSSIVHEDDTVELWNHLEGMVTVDKTNYTSIISSKDMADSDLMAAMQTPYEYLKFLEAPAHTTDIGKRPPNSGDNSSEGSVHYLIYTCLSLELFKVPKIKSLLHTYAARLPSTNLRIIFVTEDFSISEEVPDSLVSLQMDTPSLHELKGLYGAVVDDLALSGQFDAEPLKEQIDLAGKMGMGMSKTQYENSAGLSIIKALRDSEESDEDMADLVIKYISDGKKEVINNSDLLTLVPRDESMNSIGGMGNLKDWINKRKACYSDDALEFGATPPKGAVLVGVAGCGKSLVGKAIGEALGVPVVKLDIGSMFNSYVGASEDRIRKALAMAETLAPCVLFIDEIDKGLGGAGGGGDSGTSSRVLGTILSWLQENKKSVFTLVTANNITHLPPELMRRGRFDAIFSCVLPTDDERWDVLRIHLDKRGRDIEDIFPEGSEEHIDFINHTVGYVPAEIESAVVDGLVDAFADGSEDVTAAHIMDAVKAMVPMSQSYKEDVDAIIEWSSKNATPVSKPSTPAKGRTPKRAKTSSRRIRTNSGAK